MKKNICRVLVGFIVGIILCFSAQAQTVEELNRQNEELRKKIELKDEQIKLLEKNKEADAKIKSLNSGQTIAQPTPTPSNGGAGGSTGSSANNTVSPIEGVKNLFITKNNTVVNSVCKQQELEPANYTRYEKTICDVATSLVIDVQDRTRDSGRQEKIIFSPTGVNQDIAIFIIAKLAGIQSSNVNVDKDVRAFILEAENNRNDKQIGADSKGNGTTSLAVKGGIPQFLSWAVENGAAVGSRSGNTLTFRANPAGLLESFSEIRPFREVADSNFKSFFKSGDAFEKTLRNFSVGFSFDITRGTDPPTFIGSRQQLSAVSVRYNFINRKDPRDSRYIDDWEKFRQEYLDPFAKFQNQLYLKLVCEQSQPSCNQARYLNADLEKWRKDTETKLQTIDFPAVTNSIDDIKFEQLKIELVEKTRKILAEQLDLLPIDKLQNDAEVISGVTENGKVLLSYSNAKKELMDKIAKGAVVTFEYTNYREVNAPDVSNFRFIAEKGFGSNWNLTANASFSIFNKRPTGINIKRVRDFDFTMQLERPLMELSFGKPILSFSGQYQRIPGNVVAPDGTIVANTKGDIAVGQLKLTIPINGTGIKLPVSVTFANRSELIKESKVRGNFGFTFDLDRLLFGRKLF